MNLIMTMPIIGLVGFWLFTLFVIISKKTIYIHCFNSKYVVGDLLYGITFNLLSISIFIFIPLGLVFLILGFLMKTIPTYYQIWIYILALILLFITLYYGDYYVDWFLG